MRQIVFLSPFYEYGDGSQGPYNEQTVSKIQPSSVSFRSLGTESSPPRLGRVDVPRDDCRHEGLAPGETAPLSVNETLRLQRRRKQEGNDRVHMTRGAGAEVFT